jgi:hypothetical protein
VRNADTKGMTQTMTLTSREIEAMFRFDQDGWRVEVMPNMKCRSVEGRIYMDGKLVGNFCRMWQAAEMQHISFGLCAPAQRKGFATKYLAHCFAAYRAMGFEQVRVCAQGAGRTAWAKFDFEVSDAEWRRLLGQIDTQRETQLALGQISQSDYDAWYMHMLHLADMHPDLAELDEIEWEAGGESCLARLDWEGTLAL